MKVKKGILLLTAAALIVGSAGVYKVLKQRPEALLKQDGQMSLEMKLEDDEGRIKADEEVPWNLILVNRWNPVPADCKPKLVSVPGGERVDERIYEALMEMLNAAAEADLGPVVVSGYRDEEEQQELYDEKVREYQKEGYSREDSLKLAQQWVNRPGYSEHQLGIAVDINGATYDIYLWLQEHSYKYGFIFRYPGDKTEITGGAEEVWHYRYVGIEAAAEIRKQGICLEEYLARMQDK